MVVYQLPLAFLLLKNVGGGDAAGMVGHGRGRVLDDTRGDCGEGAAAAAMQRSAAASGTRRHAEWQVQHLRTGPCPRPTPSLPHRSQMPGCTQAGRWRGHRVWRGDANAPVLPEQREEQQPHGPHCLEARAGLCGNPHAVRCAMLSCQPPAHLPARLARCAHVSAAKMRTSSSVMRRRPAPRIMRQLSMTWIGHRQCTRLRVGDQQPDGAVD